MNNQIGFYFILQKQFFAVHTTNIESSNTVKDNEVTLKEL